MSLSRILATLLTGVLLSTPAWPRAGGGQSYRSSSGGGSSSSSRSSSSSGSSSRSSSSSSSSSYSTSRSSFSSGSSARGATSSSSSGRTSSYTSTERSTFFPQHYGRGQALQGGRGYPRELLPLVKAFANAPNFLETASTTPDPLVRSLYRKLGPNSDILHAFLLNPPPFFNDYTAASAPGSLAQQLGPEFSGALSEATLQAEADKAAMQMIEIKLETLSWDIRNWTSAGEDGFQALKKRTFQQWLEQTQVEHAPPIATVDIPFSEGKYEGFSLRAWFLTLFALVGSISFAIAWMVQREGRKNQELYRKIAAGSTPFSPDWRNDPFLVGFEKLFLAIQDSWNSGDFKGVSRLISDGVRDRFEVGIRLNALAGFRNSTEGMKVLSLEKLSHSKTEHFERCVVRVRASSKDVDHNLKTGSLLEDRGTSEFEELWGLIRSTEAPTVSSTGWQQANCPACGAEVPTGIDSSNCPSCRILLNSGDHGWVLAEITQSSETLRSMDLPSLPGLRELKAKDPFFESQYLEDRASAILYRIFEARSRCQPPLLRPFVSGALYRATEHVLRKPHPRGPYRGLAVGSAQITHAELGTHAADGTVLDFVTVELHWNAHDREASPARLRFARSATARNAKRRALMSFHCASCGAPETQERDRPECAACGSPTNDLKGEWTLMEFKLGDPSDLPELTQSMKAESAVAS